LWYNSTSLNEGENMKNISFKIGENTFHIGTKSLKPYVINGIVIGLLEALLSDGTSILISPSTGELISYDTHSDIIGKIIPEYCEEKSTGTALILREQKIVKQ